MPRILLVDDHEIVRAGLKRLIETNAAYAVCGEAVNGQEAVEKALSLRPDLIVLDLSMPVMNGIHKRPQKFVNSRLRLKF